MVDLELKLCDITLTVGWLQPARLRRLSLEDNELSSFRAFLPCCEYLCLSYNSLTEVEFEAPILEHINLATNKLTSIPKLPARLQVLILSSNRLNLSQMSELPSNLKVADLLGDFERPGTGVLKNYTFPSSIQELDLSELDLSRMGGVKFAKGSRLKQLDMSYCNLKIVSDRMIELPLGLKSLELHDNRLENISKLTIPQTVTSLDLNFNNFERLKIKSHIESLKLCYNSRLSRLTIPKKLELKFLDLTLTGFEKFSFDIIGAQGLSQLRLGHEMEEIDVSRMPVTFRLLEYPGTHEIEGLHRYPKTNLWRPLP